MGAGAIQGETREVLMCALRALRRPGRRRFLAVFAVFTVEAARGALASQKNAVGGGRGRAKD